MFWDLGQNETQQSVKGKKNEKGCNSGNLVFGGEREERQNIPVYYMMPGTAVVNSLTSGMRAN